MSVLIFLCGCASTRGEHAGSEPLARGDWHLNAGLRLYDDAQLAPLIEREKNLFIKATWNFEQSLKYYNIALKISPEWGHEIINMKIKNAMKYLDLMRMKHPLDREAARKAAFATDGSPDGLTPDERARERKLTGELEAPESNE